jgi:hypothetical protein
VSASSPARSVVSGTSHVRTPTAAARVASGTGVSDSEAAEINPTQVLAETAALEKYFQHGFQVGQEMNNDEGGESDEDEQGGIISDNEDSQVVDNPKTRPALAWADKFILETRRKGGRQTENSVLKLWKVLCPKIIMKISWGHPPSHPSHLIYLDMDF